MSLLIIIAAIFFLPSAIAAAIDIGKLVFKGISYVLGGFLFIAFMIVTLTVILGQ